MVPGNLKVYRLVIYLGLSVSFVSGKINVTNNVICCIASSVSCFTDSSLVTFEVNINQKENFTDW